jgi:hypothetical protein
LGVSTPESLSSKAGILAVVGMKSRVRCEGREMMILNVKV